MPGKNLHTLRIEKLVPGGLGLGRLADGIIVLVRYVLPGEEVLVQETGRKKDYISAILKQVLSPSPDRIETPCPIYGLCGGCDLQHAGPEAQIHLKKAILTDNLQRAAGNIFSSPAVLIEDPLPAPEQFGYRQRIRLQVDGKGNYGFYRPGSYIVEPVVRCLLAREELNTALQQLHASHSFRRLLPYCNAFELLFNPEKKDTLLLLHFLRKPRSADRLSAKMLADDTCGISTILLQVQGRGLYDPLAQAYPTSAPILSYLMAVEESKAELRLTWEANGFCQVNLEQNSNMVKIVQEMTASGPHNRILDLYCGYGNFSLPVATLDSEVLGIDGQNAAIRSAHRNAMLNGIHNCRFAKQEVPAAVNALIAAGRTFETIILDPPRQGASAIVSQLPKLDADQIIYISCNPATLARDLASLIPAGYQMSRLVPVDMFPQTHHLESVTLLKRSFF